MLYQANQFTVMRQVRYSEKTDHSLDLVLFLNGLPLFTAELKNPLNDQDVTDAITQYRRTRDPREPVFALGRCLAHFAVDPFLVYVTTQLQGRRDGLPAVQPGRRRGQGPRGRQSAAQARQRLQHRLPVARGLGAGQRPRPDAVFRPGCPRP